MRHLRNVRLPARRLPARRLPAVGLVALLFAAAGCDDELSNPQQSLVCDEQLEIVVDDVPASVRYLVAVAGDADLQSVTYTTTEGEMTRTDFDQAADNIVFDETVAFVAPVEAVLRARGDVSSGGEIAIAFTIIFADGSRFDSDPSVCAV